MSSLTKRQQQEQSLKYDGVMLFWRTVTQIFFREIRPRGAFNIPRDGPVIFVGAPHNNQVRQKTDLIGLLLSSLRSSWTHCCYPSKYIARHTDMYNS